LGLLFLTACQVKEDKKIVPKSTPKRVELKKKSLPASASASTPSPAASPLHRPSASPQPPIESAPTPIAVYERYAVDPLQSLQIWQDLHPMHFKKYQVLDESHVRVFEPRFSFLDQISPIGVLLDVDLEGKGIFDLTSSLSEQLTHICLFFGFTRSTDHELLAATKTDQVAIFHSHQLPPTDAGIISLLFNTIYNGDSLLETGRLQKLTSIDCYADTPVNDVLLVKNYQSGGSPQTETLKMLLTEGADIPFLLPEGKKILEKSLSLNLNVDQVYLNDNRSISLQGHWPGSFESSESLDALCKIMGTGEKAVRPILGNKAGIDLLTCSLEKPSEVPEVLPTPETSE